MIHVWSLIAFKIHNSRNLRILKLHHQLVRKLHWSFVFTLLFHPLPISDDIHISFNCLLSSVFSIYNSLEILSSRLVSPSSSYCYFLLSTSPLLNSSSHFHCFLSMTLEAEQSFALPHDLDKPSFFRLLLFPTQGNIYSFLVLLHSPPPHPTPRLKRALHYLTI